MNPQEIVMQLLGNNINPFFANLVQLAMNGKDKEVEQIGRNFYKETNRDFDKEYSQLRQNPLSMLNQGSYNNYKKF